MKKTLYIILSVLLILSSIVSCGKKKDPADAETTEVVTTAAPETTKESETEEAVTTAESEKEETTAEEDTIEAETTTEAETTGEESTTEDIEEDDEGGMEIEDDYEIDLDDGENGAGL